MQIVITSCRLVDKEAIGLLRVAWCEVMPPSTQLKERNIPLFFSFMLYDFFLNPAHVALLCTACSICHTAPCRSEYSISFLVWRTGVFGSIRIYLHAIRLAQRFV